MVLSMKDEKTFDKVNKITNIITITVCTCLGAIFVAACVYMLQLISTEQKKQNNTSQNQVQNMSVVEM